MPTHSPAPFLRNASGICAERGIGRPPGPTEPPLSVELCAGAGRWELGTRFWGEIEAVPRGTQVVVAFRNFGGMNGRVQGRRAGPGVATGPFPAAPVATFRVTSRGEC